MSTEYKASQQAEASTSRVAAPEAASLPNLSHVTLRELGDWNDPRFEGAAADVLRQLGRVDSSVAGHNS